MEEETNLFVPDYDNQYTKEEVDILNMEVTDEVQAVIDSMLLDSAKKDMDMYVPPSDSTDLERQLDINIPLFEAYIAVTKEREVLQEKWEALRYVRSTWWSLFKEEMEWNWNEYDRFVDRLDKRLRVVSPTDEQWKAAMIMKSRVYEHCMSVLNQRRSVTYPIYQKAKAATDRCREFWKTSAGIRLNELNEQRSGLWDLIQDLDVTFDDYNSLLEEVLTPYWTSGDTEEVDEQELVANTPVETMDLLEFTHSEEMKAYTLPIGKGKGFWSNRNMYKVNASHTVASAAVEEADYQNSLLSYYSDTNNDVWNMRGNNSGQVQMVLC